MLQEENKIVDIVTEVKDSYLDYAMSVIVSRALPDVRDGLKPVHRRILYTMHELGLHASGRFRKCAKITGDTTGNYHPHGTTAVYDSLVRLAQDFSLRYPLIIGQGNFGSVDGDAAAAERYTEAKLSRIAGELLRDIEKETVDFIPNYDSTRLEPTVLPSVIPNILLNGTLGIAVGMATKIPPHNLGELVAAINHLIDEPEATADDLLRFVTGPDFPTGGVVYNEADIRHAYASGRGGVLLRGEAEIMEAKAGQSSVVITSLPYQVNKADLIVRMADLVREKKLEGIKDIRDESTTLEDTRVVVELKAGAYPQKVLNALYKHTELETVFHYNMLALVDGVPKLLSLKAILEEFISFRQEVVVRRTKHDLRLAEERAHILEGLNKALDHIDEVIKTIKRSKDANEAEKNLIKQFTFSVLQAKAILEMKLQRLAGLERKKIEDELAEKLALIKELRALLNDPKKVLGTIRGELTAIKDKYGDARKTKVMRHGVSDIKAEDLIPEKEDVLVVTRGGYVKRTDPSEYRAQRRGGVGVVDLDMREEDFVKIFLTANTHDDLLFFSDRGKAYQIKMYDVPEGKRATRGKSVMNFLPLAENEAIASVLVLPKIKSGATSLMLVTKKGLAKKMLAKSFADVRRSGIIAITLEAGDELLAALLLQKSDDVLLATARGQAIRFSEAEIRETGRTARGVRAIRLRSNDAVIGASLVPGGGAVPTYLTVTANGFGKRSKASDYKTQGRGGSGIKTAAITAKTGSLIAGRVLNPQEKEVIAISRQGQVIRTGLDQVPILNRATQGVRLMRLRAGDSLASITCL